MFLLKYPQNLATAGTNFYPEKNHNPGYKDFFTRCSFPLALYIFRNSRIIGLTMYWPLF
jgi:hypothetical protein